MQLDYYMPRPDLASYIRCYYYFVTETDATQPLSAELGNIRVVLSGGGDVQLPGGAALTLANASLIGPTSSAYVIEARAGTRVFGVGILPRGWGALFGISAAEVADRVIELAAFMGPTSSAAMERIRAAASLPEMAAIADAYFATLIERRARRNGYYPAAIERWLLDPGDLDLDRLVGMMDVSRRQTDRLAKQYFGASPKLLQRKYRALRAAGRLLASTACWRAAAGEAFYDQSHFIKEFRAFVGVTPLEFLNNQAMLAAAAREARGRAVASHPLAEL